jgi:hypothetical protein
VNGLPLAVIELKNAADETPPSGAPSSSSRPTSSELPSLFVFNELLVVSDGLEARIGTLSSNKERFLPWRTIEGEALAPTSLSQLEVLIRGVFDKRRFLDLLRYFIVFEDDGATVIKKVAGYHQFHAVARPSTATVRPRRPQGRPRVGVVWHTQGSGKSLTMAFYAGRVVLHPAMENPTLVVLTDRNDLDEQLFGTFSRCKDLLRQTPSRPKDRTHLRELLQGRLGRRGVHDHPEVLPESAATRSRCSPSARNIVVIADEAHRSQYDFIDGFARSTCATRCRTRRSSASRARRSSSPTRTRARCSATTSASTTSSAPSRTARRSRSTTRAASPSSSSRRTRSPKLDEEFEEADRGRGARGQGEAQDQVGGAGGAGRADRTRSSSSRRPRRALREPPRGSMDGKAMIVCMSRRICVDLYARSSRCAPSWHDDDDDDQGAIKVVMTGSASDPADWQPHIRSKRGARRSRSASRTRRPAQARDRARHVAHRLRRAVPAHDVRRQADAGPRADAGHRAREPRVPRQARRPRRRLPRPRRPAQEGAAHLHRERRQGRDRARPGRGRRADARALRGLLRDLPRLRLERRGLERLAAGRRSACRCCPPRRSTCWPRRTARSAAPGGHRALEGVRARGAARRGDPHPRRRRLLPGRARGHRQDVGGRPRKAPAISTTRSARSSRRPSPAIR